MVIRKKIRMIIRIIIWMKRRVRNTDSIVYVHDNGCIGGTNGVTKSKIHQKFGLLPWQNEQDLLLQITDSLGSKCKHIP